MTVGCSFLYLDFIYSLFVDDCLVFMKFLPDSGLYLSI